MTLLQHDGRNQSELSEFSEAVLVRQAQAGEEAAFEELMRRCWSRCFRLALSILRNSDDAKDETQNAFWKAYLHIGSFASEAKFSTWVCRIVINHCVMRLRSKQGKRTVSYDKLPGVHDNPYLRDRRAGNPEQDLASQQVLERLHAELRRVPKILRMPLELRYLQELPLPEMAARLGVSVAAAKSRLARGHFYLRDRMKVHVGGQGLALR